MQRAGFDPLKYRQENTLNIIFQEYFIQKARK